MIFWFQKKTHAVTPGSPRAFFLASLAFSFSFLRSRRLGARGNHTQPPFLWIQETQGLVIVFVLCVATKLFF